MPVDIEKMLENLPPEARTALESAGYLEADRLSVGDTAPELALMPRNGGEPVVVGARNAERPVVLIFGSYT